MSQTLTFVACGCRIQTSQTQELIPEKMVRECKYHKRTIPPKSTMKEKYKIIYDYSRRYVTPYGKMDKEKMSLVLEDVQDAARLAIDGVVKSPATAEEIKERIKALRKKNGTSVLGVINDKLFKRS